MKEHFSKNSILHKSPLRFSALIVLALGLQSTLAAQAEDQAFTVKGSARVRFEHKNNADFKDQTRDTTESIASRFRLDMAFNPNENVMVFFQPQFSKVWGGTEYVPSSASANTPKTTSGDLNDTRLDVHQAFINYKEFTPMQFTMGRKELAYGDHLLVGNVGWHNTGRAFDLLMGSYSYEQGTVDVFTSKVKESNASSAGPGDKDFSGIYSSNKFSDVIDNLDAYVFYLYDGSGTTNEISTTYGLRAKSTMGLFDYRVEGTAQTVTANNKDTGENQIDGELGYVVYEPKKVRLSAEYFAGSDDFRQLFPTGHKWLGYADLFSRRNIEGYRIGVSAQVSEKTQVSVDYHSFSRRDDSKPAYNLIGGAYTGSGNDKELASEIDLVVGHKLANLNLEAGYSTVSPGAYMKTNLGKDNTEFYYLQASTTF